MDRLPCELFRNILQYIDQASDLLRMSYVCSHWRFAIINDEYYLNRWFLRSLERSRKSYSGASAFHVGDCKRLHKLNLDESLFPVNLRSSHYEFLPWIVSRNSTDYEVLFEHAYSVSFCDSSHSFSFWLFLPRRCKLNIQVGNCNVEGWNIFLCSDKQYHFDDGESFSIADRWIHIVLAKINSKSNYRICIDGQCITKLKQRHVSISRVYQYYSLFNILLCRKFDNNLLVTSNQARIADLNAFTRCLTLMEIQAIHQQQVPIKQVKVGHASDVTVRYC